MELSGLLIKMAVFFTVMVIGYAAARTKKVGTDFAKGASWLTVNVFMTATIVNSAISNVPAVDGGELAGMMAVVSAAFVIMYAVGIAASKLLRQDRDHEGLAMAVMTVPNNMFIALPVLQELYGAEAVLYVSLSCLPFNILLYTYCVWRIKSGEGKFRFEPREMLSVPLLATVAALILFVLRVDVPRPARELLSCLSSATVPLSMMVVGASLGSISLADAFKGRDTYLIAAVKLLAAPTAVWLIVRCLTDSALIIAVCTVIAASPTGIIITALALNYGRDAVYVSKNTLANTALSMATIPLIVYLFGL